MSCGPSTLLRKGSIHLNFLFLLALLFITENPLPINTPPPTRNCHVCLVLKSMNSFSNPLTKICVPDKHFYDMIVAL